MKNICLLLLSITTATASNNTVSNFNKAKKILTKLYGEKNYTFYCGCQYKSKKVNLDSCGYKNSKYPIRKRRIEWEHIVPASTFGMSFQEWTKGSSKCFKKSVIGTKKYYKGRKCAQKNPYFARIEADMYNLVPAIGALNAMRSNFKMNELPNIPKGQFGKCGAKLGNSSFEPPRRVKGDIARTYMYMHKSYPKTNIIKSSAEVELYKRWSRLDPVDIRECQLAKRIMQLQQNENKYVSVPCKKAGKW